MVVVLRATVRSRSVRWFGGPAGLPGGADRPGYGLATSTATGMVMATEETAPRGRPPPLRARAGGRRGRQGSQAQGSPSGDDTARLHVKITTK